MSDVASAAGKGNYERLTPDKRRRFLRALARGYTASGAAELAGVSRRQTLYELRPRSPRFARAWQRAWDAGEAAIEAREAAEREANARARRRISRARAGSGRPGRGSQRAAG